MEHLEIKKKLWNLVETHKQELLEICSGLIRIPSVEQDGIEQIVQHVCQFLADLQIPYEVLRPVDWTPCIVAEFGGGDGPVGLLNGHCDVVSPGDVRKWNYDPFCGTITDTQVLGRGASDMKCGVGIFLFLLKLMKEHDLRLQGKLKLHIVHDEEKGGEKGSKWLAEHGYADDVDFCIITEPTSYDYVEVGQKGRCRVRLRTRGAESIRDMIRVLSRIQEISRLEGPVTEQERKTVADSRIVICGSMKRDDVGPAIDHVNVNVLNITGGTGAEPCEAYVAMGVPFMITRDMIEKKLQEITAGVPCEVEFECWQNGSRTDATAPFVRSVQKNAEYLTGRTMYAAYQWATSDAKYYRWLGIPAVHFGPANNKGIHSYNEDVEIVDIMKCAKTHIAVLQDMIGFEEAGGLQV